MVYNGYTKYKKGYVMDVNTNNIINNSITDVSTLSNAVNVKSLSQSQQIDVDGKNSFTIDTSVVNKRSNLTDTLKEFMDKLTTNQTTQSMLNQQSTILNDLKSMMQTIKEAEVPDDVANEIQPTVQEHLSQYNTLSSDISKNIDKFQEDTDSTAYFDGILGAKPLSPSEILDQVEKQMELVKIKQDHTSNELQKVEHKALDTIGKEITKSKEEAPFKPIDFGNHTSNFTSANINNVIGSVVTSQANAIPANSPKLLA